MRHRLARGLGAPARLAAARLRADVPGALSLFVLVSVTSFVFAAAPRAFTAISDDALQDAVAGANQFERNLDLSSAQRIAAGRTDPFATVDARGADFARGLAPELTRLFGNRRAAAATPRYLVVEPPGERGPAGTIRFFTARFVGGAQEHLRVVEGRLPRTSDRAVASPFLEEAPLGAERQQEVPVVEVAVTRETARRLGVGIGDRFFARPDTDDPLVNAFPLGVHRYLALAVTGLLEPTQPNEGYWAAEVRLRRPVVRTTETVTFIDAEGLFARDDYGRVLAGVAPLTMRYSWRFQLEPRRLSAETLGPVAAEIRRLQARYGSGAVAVAGTTNVRTGLSAVFERFERARDAAAAVLAVGGLGLLAVALLVVGLVAGLGAERRGFTVEAVRSRGGSVAQALAEQAFEALAAAVPAASVGFVAALVLVDGRATVFAALLASAVLVGATALVVATAVGPARRGLRSSERGDVAVARLSARRLGAEAFTILVAGLGVYLLRRRGLSSDGGFDVYLAAVPVLVGLAAGLAVLRLYPLPARVLAWSAARRQDLVPALGLARVARQPSATAAPLVALLVALAVAVFGAALAATIADGASESPFHAGTLRALRIGLVAVVAYAALAVLLSTTLTTRSRARDLTYLRTLGLSLRQTLVLTAVELGPPLAAGLVGGAALGAAVAYLVRPGLALGDLAAGAGSGIAVDVLTTLALVGVLLAVSAAAIVAAGTAARRASLSQALRSGER